MQYAMGWSRGKIRVATQIRPKAAVATLVLPSERLGASFTRAEIALSLMLDW